jgi:phage terminase large subunit
MNPANNWIKKDFYLPFIQETLPENIVFIPSLVTDNPHVPQTYIQMLKELPPQQRKRLLEGDWNYMEEEDSLFRFEDISNSIFKFSPDPNEKKYMTIDVARFGSDRSVVMIWVGLCLIECHIFQKIDTVQLSDEIKDLIKFHGIHIRNVITDSDGVGGGVADILKSTNFVNNSKPLHEQNFSNLKSQCYVKLSDMFKQGLISINLSEPSMVEDLTQELLAVKLKDVDKDNKVQIHSKDEMKRILGKSPDLSDCMMERMYYEIKNLKSTGRYAISMI